MILFRWLVSLRLLIRRLIPTRLRRFGLVGVTASAVDFSVFTVLLALLGASVSNAIIANTAGFTAAALVGYLLNSRYTFTAVRSRASFARYVIVALIGVGIYNTGFYLLLSQIGTGSVPMIYLAKVMAIAPSATWNFVGFSLFAFKKRGTPEADVRPAIVTEGRDGGR